MQLCPHCGLENFEGIVYCERCGVALVAVSLSTRQLENAEEGKGGTDELGLEGVLIFQIEHDPTPILIQIRHEVILGRMSEPSESSTYLNLSPYGADEAGVSRRHARLLREDKFIFLLDLNSTNGTSLNGELLPNGIEKRVRDGDEITLGQLKLYVYFKV